MLHNILHVIARRWYLFAAAFGIAALFTTAVTLSGDNTPDDFEATYPATAAMGDVPTTTASVDPLAAADLADMQEWRSHYASGYDCPANDTAKTKKDLRLCPDYTVTIKMTPGGKPQVTYSSDTARKAITVHTKFYHSCGNDGVKSVPVTCEDYWRVTWSVNAPYAALGYNELWKGYDNVTAWHGVYAMGVDNGNQVMDDRSFIYEIYAGDPGHVQSQPLSADREPVS